MLRSENFRNKRKPSRKWPLTSITRRSSNWSWYELTWVMTFISSYRITSSFLSLSNHEILETYGESIISFEMFVLGCCSHIVLTHARFWMHSLLAKSSAFQGRNKYFPSLRLQECFSKMQNHSKQKDSAFFPLETLARRWFRLEQFSAPIVRFLLFFRSLRKTYRINNDSFKRFVSSESDDFALCSDEYLIKEIELIIWQISELVLRGE